MAKTRATQQLEQARLPFQVLHYTYDPEAASIGLHAAQSLGLPASEVFKTLMVTVGSEACIAVVPSDRELNLKAMAAAAGGKSCAMIKPADAERISGYHIGGISPLGQKKRLRCFVDDSALGLALMVVNGGQRGMQIRIKPADLLAALGAQVFPLTAPPS